VLPDTGQTGRLGGWWNTAPSLTRRKGLGLDPTMQATEDDTTPLAVTEDDIEKLIALIVQRYNETRVAAILAAVNAADPKQNTADIAIVAANLISNIVDRIPDNLPEDRKTVVEVINRIAERLRLPPRAEAA
jgi:hypothetical protein